MKVRVLFLGASVAMRGAQQTLVEHLRLLFAKEFECLVVAPPGDGPFSSALKSIGVKTVSCEQPWWVTSGGLDHWLYCIRQLPEAVARVQRIIHDEHIDVVYSNAGVSPVGAFAAVRERKPHIWHVRECYTNTATHLSSPASQPTLAATIGDLACFVIVPSKHVAEEYLPWVPVNKIRLVYSGVDCRRFEGISNVKTNRRVIALGTTSVAKGLDDLVEAGRLLFESGVPFNIYVIGSFDSSRYKMSVKESLRKIGISDLLVFHGWQEDVSTWLGQANILCCPSHAESFGRAVVEGMASGLPVVASRCGGPEEIVVDGETGYLIPKKDPFSLAYALRALLESSEIASMMGSKGRARANELFDVRRTAQQITHIIYEAASVGKWSSPATGTAEMLFSILEKGGPRILLGKKWRLFSRLFSFLGKPI